MINFCHYFVHLFIGSFFETVNLNNVLNHSTRSMPIDDNEDVLMTMYVAIPKM